jgi:TRAP-type C4-dicarboxylate transport system substrate-binding protein
MILFSRERITSMDEMRRATHWLWDRGELWQRTFEIMRLRTAPTAVYEAGRALDEGRVNALWSIPTGALVYQWSGRTRYYVDLGAGQLPVCNIIAQRALDQLSTADQQAVRAAGARLERRFEDVSAMTDSQLLDTLFAKQGLTRVEPSAQFKTEFLEAARLARTKLPEELISHEALATVLSWLGDFRGEHGTH